MQSEEEAMSLKVLREHGWSIAALAREFTLNWRTVKRELESPDPRRYGPRLQLFALNVAQVAHIERRLVVCPSIRGTDLHAELRSDYSYEGFRRRATGAVSARIAPRRRRARMTYS